MSFKEINEFDKIFKRTQGRVASETQWITNTLYYLGEQWIGYFKHSKKIGPKYILPSNQNKAMPVDNKILPYVRDMTSIFLNTQVKTTVWPNSTTIEDKIAAKLGDEVLEWLDEQDETKERIEELVKGAIITGTSFGRVVKKLDTVHKVSLEVLSPHNVFLPLFQSSKLCNLPYIGIEQLCLKQEIEDQYSIKIEDDGMDSYLDRSVYSLIPDISVWKSHAVQHFPILNKNIFEDAVLLREIEFKPTKKYPRGRHVGYIGKQIIFDNKTLPIPQTKNQWNYSIVPFQFESINGQSWGLCGVKNLIGLQDAINNIDQLIETNRKDLGVPYIFAPKGAGFKRIPGRVKYIEFDAMRSQGIAPTIRPGVQVNPEVFAERGIKEAAIAGQKGDPDRTIQGKSHPGSSGSLFFQTRNAAASNYAFIIDRFFNVVNKLNMLRLLVAQKEISGEQLLKTKSASALEIRYFKGANLKGNTDVRFEISNRVPISHEEKIDLLLKMGQYGFFGNMLENPEQVSEIIEAFKIDELGGLQQQHKDRAFAENAIFVKITEKNVKKIALPAIQTDQGFQTVTDDPRFEFDDHVIHVRIHSVLTLSSEWDTLSEETQTICLQHLALHKAVLEAKANEEMQRAMVMQQQMGAQKAAQAMPRQEAQQQER